MPTNDIHLNAAQAGPADGPLLIFLHGFPGFWYDRRNQLEHFANLRYRVWAPDQRSQQLNMDTQDEQDGFILFILCIHV